MDVAIVARPISTGRLRSEFLMDDPISVVVGKRHPLARQKSVSFRVLSGHAIVVRERGSRLREMIDVGFLELGTPPSRIIPARLAIHSISGRLTRAGTRKHLHQVDRPDAAGLTIDAGAVRVR